MVITVALQGGERMAFWGDQQGDLFMNKLQCYAAGDLSGELEAKAFSGRWGKLAGHVKALVGNLRNFVAESQVSASRVEAATSEVSRAISVSRTAADQLAQDLAHLLWWSVGVRVTFVYRRRSEMS